MMFKRNCTCKNRTFDIVCLQNFSRVFKVCHIYLYSNYSLVRSWFAYLWNFKKLWSLLRAVIFPLFLWWSAKCQNQTKMFIDISVYLVATFIKSTSPYPSHITIFWYSKNNYMMTNSTYDCLICFSQCGSGLKIDSVWKQPEAGVNTQPYNAICTFKSYPGQHTTPHCTLDI